MPRAGKAQGSRLCQDGFTFDGAEAIPGKAGTASNIIMTVRLDRLFKKD
jgi:hypothetical protein